MVNGTIPNNGLSTIDYRLHIKYIRKHQRRHNSGIALYNKLRSFNAQLAPM